MSDRFFLNRWILAAIWMWRFATGTGRMLLGAAAFVIEYAASWLCQLRFGLSSIA
jgi:hypothetical protein